MKGNFLRKNMSYDVQIVKIGPPVFCTAQPFTQPPKSYTLQCLSVGQTLAKVPIPVRASTSSCNTCSQDQPYSAFRTASRSVQPFSNSSRQRVHILYNVY